MDDAELLKEFVDHGSQRAFSELVHKHVRLVYSAALRQLRDAHLARDVAQNVFLDLARKAAALPNGTVLSGWLVVATHYAASNLRIAEQRRRHREREAAAMAQLTEHEPAGLWEELSPLLDGALARLGAASRDAIVLRYLEGKNVREVARALGVSEVAAKRRLARGLEQLRAYFAHHGIALPASAIACAIPGDVTHAAPVATVDAVLAATRSAAVLRVSGPLKGALKIMQLLKAKPAIMALRGLCAVVALTAVLVAAATRSNADDVDHATSIELGTPALHIRWSADGRSLLAFSPIKPSDPGCRVLRIDPDAGSAPATVATDPTGNATDYAALSPDGRYWAQQDLGKPGVYRIQIGDLDSGRTRVTLPETDYREWSTMGLMRMMFSGDGKKLFTLQRNGQAQLWDAVTGRQLRSLRLQEGPPIENAVLSPDGRRIASVGQDAVLKLWDVDSGASKSLDDNVTCHNLQFSPDGRLLAVASNEGVQVWSVADAKADSKAGAKVDAKKLHDLNGQEGFVYSLAFTPDSKRLATGTIQVGRRDPKWRGTVRLWDLTSGRPLRTLSGFKEGVLCLAFSRDAKRLASSSNWENSVRIWKLVVAGDAPEK